VKFALVVLAFAVALPFTLRAEQAAGDDVVTMEPFNVTAYGGRIRIIDGFTGKDYAGSNDVVLNFAASFNKLLTGYHKKLVLDEIEHMRFRLKLGKDFEREMGRINAAFGFGGFALDDSTWLRRERAIITRLIREPFFKIKALVVWDVDRLNQLAPNRPSSKYAADIRFDPETRRWERRITARWDVSFFRDPANPRNQFVTEKLQGLNLDTHRGFHFIEQGLPVHVPSNAFHEVSLTYPIFYSEREAGEKELAYLQRTFVANLIFIYDPFSWVARRETRFRGGYIGDCVAHIQAQRIHVDDREWFDPVFARFLSDVITIRLQGVEEIYALHRVTKRLGESPRALGLGLDLLNWNKGEKRDAPDRPEESVRISPRGPGGFRYVLIDAYQRFGDALVDRIRSELVARKERREKGSGEAMLRGIIEELSAVPYDEFARRAKAAQEEALARQAVEHPILRSRPAAGPGKG
jgi:hypothetical protein